MAYKRSRGGKRIRKPFRRYTMRRGGRRPPPRKYGLKRKAPRVYSKLLRMPAPDRCFTKMKYVQLINDVTPNTGLIRPIFWQSSLYDPEKGVGGHQPLWHDQWSNIYNNYRVHGIKYRMSVNAGYGTTGSFWSAVTVYPNSSGGALSSADFQTETERVNCQGKRFHPVYNDGKAYYSGYLNIPVVEGLTKREFLGDEGYAAAFGANPSKMGYIALLMKSIDAAVPVQGIATFTYYVEMWGRKTVAGS